MITSWSLRLLTVMTGTLLIASQRTDDKAKAPEPVISGGNRYFLAGETISINCSVKLQDNIPIVMTWNNPKNTSKVRIESNEYDARETLINYYWIDNAGPGDAGRYECIANSNYDSGKAYFDKIFLDEPKISFTQTNDPRIETSAKILKLRVMIDDYPVSNVTVLKNNALPPPKVKFEVRRDKYNRGECLIKLTNLTVEDSGNYTIVARNQFLTNTSTYDVRVKGIPMVSFGKSNMQEFKFEKGTIATLTCNTIGYPQPQITWKFQYEGGEKVLTEDVTYIDSSVYRATSQLRLPVNIAGNVTCRASSGSFSNEATRPFIAYEMPNGFGIKNTDHTWFAQHENVVLICIASKYEFNNITWLDPNYQDFENVEFSTNSLSIIAKLIINEISVDQSGTYSCIGTRTNGSDANQTISITVEEIQPAMIEDHENQNIEVLIHYEVNFTCSAEAVPPPHIEWYKDGRLLLGDQNIKILTSDVAHKSIHSTVIIDRLREEDVGTYDCKVEGTDLSKSYNLAIKEKPSNKAYYLSAIGVIFFFLIVLVVYLAWKIRREKQFRKELAAAGLLNFKEGATKSINPELGIDEQAELLPYDEKFEFPAEKLILGKQLGAGAFGVVYKADARGILNAEETTTVAVKMVKKNADNMYIKALASELKIMVHMGKHVNIVNLLGACTKNVGKRELIVIVEYCKYGNIHNYIFKHRGVFIDQLTDNAEKNLGKVNRGYSSSSANSGNHSDYFGSNQTQETNQTFVNTANTNRSGRVSETSYVQPEWRSNYESDYSFEGLGPRPLCSRDLLAWAFQIARGMEYLASKKVLHGDLAARNVLLSDDNVVKICDFGLARSIYKNDEYQKQENSPLPVKWLAIECMTDRIFSTQSDVWSFGIVLWELFSLAKTPYPNISPQCLLQFLTEGRRLEKPRHADDKLYAVMQRCWEEKPTNRPSFSELQHILGSFLEDNVRNHYVDLNAIYMDANTQRQGEDYLDMVSAPDYNNMVTPSPHHYVNDARSFFPPSPTTLQHDDEGYLQMSPASRQNMFNARNTGTKFDFDSRKLTPRVSDVNNYGSELTPMLTLNNMPRSGSESDQEGNVSPYLNMCPRIEEETDEVFDTKQNNAKNVAPPADSHSNLTYFAFNVNDEKKPQNFANSYINVPNVNGLVK